MSRKKIYVLDTSVYLTNADAVYAFKNHDVYVPLKVFEEIDKHKKRQDLVGAQARKIIRIWDELRTRGCLKKKASGSERVWVSFNLFRRQTLILMIFQPI